MKILCANIVMTNEINTICGIGHASKNLFYGRTLDHE